MKTLIRKNNKEYAFIDHEGEVFTCTLPKLLGDINEEDLIKYFHTYYGLNISYVFEKYELKEVEIIIK